MLKKRMSTDLYSTEEREDLIIDLENKDVLLKEINILNKRLYEENQRLKKEKEEALSRLSKIAGQKLTKGNPSITDLSNPNRSAKISERWSSLYTDEWMDAYEEIRVKNKKQNQSNIPEKQLLWNVDWCYRKCSTLAGDQMKQIQPFLKGIAGVLSFQDQPGQEKDSTICDAGFDNKNLEETIGSFVEHFKSQRQIRTELVDTVKEICIKDFGTIKPDAGPNERKFVEKCCELCWYMNMSDPPMVIEYENLEGKYIDWNKFNKYDKPGTTVEFVVWPVLLLHKDGPVLAKGTVQTFNDVEKFHL